MADKTAGAGFKSPLRFAHEGSKAAPGHRHYLDGCPSRLVDRLSLINDDPEQGTLVFGVANDMVEPPAIDIGAASAEFFPWTLTSGSANAPTAPTQPNTAGGVLRVQSSGTADNDSAILKLVEAPFRYSTSKEIWFACRFAVQATNTGEQLVGLINTAYSPADPATLPTDGLFFSKATAATDFTFNARNGGVSTSIANVLALASVTLTADTQVELAFRVTAGAVIVFVNGIRVGSIAAGTANLPATTTALQCATLVATSAAATKYMDIDHILVAQER